MFRYLQDRGIENYHHKGDNHRLGVRIAVRWRRTAPDVQVTHVFDRHGICRLAQSPATAGRCAEDGTCPADGI